MQYPLCRHIHTSGIQCGSPSLAGRKFCYFHDRQRVLHKNFQYTGEARVYYDRGTCVEVGSIEDRTSIQMALSTIVNALSVNQIDVKRANAMLYGLQLATMNLPRKGTLTPEPDQVVRDLVTTAEGFEFAEPGALTPDLDAAPVPTPPDAPTRQPTLPSATIVKLIASPTETAQCV